MNTRSHTTLKALVAGLSAFVFLAGAVGCFLSPERAWAWLLAMFSLPFAWVVLQRVAGRKAGTILSPRADREHLQAMALAASMLSVSLSAVLVSRLGWVPGYEAELSERSWGFLMGVIVVFFANVIPKQAGSAQRQAKLRIVGWALVLGGLGYSASWLVVPLAYANLVAMTVLMSAMLYAIGRLAWNRMDGGPLSPPSR